MLATASTLLVLIDMDMSATVNLRAVLKRHGCPSLTDDTEDNEVFIDLLMTPSVQRTNLLHWLADLIIGCPPENEEQDKHQKEKRQKEKLGQVLRLSPEFMSGQAPRPTQLPQWKKLCQMFEAQVNEDTNNPKVMAWSKTFQRSLLTQGLARAVPKTKALVDLVPRDMARTRAAKGRRWTSDQLQNILQHLEDKVEALPKEPGFHGSAENYEGDQLELIEKLRGLTGQFLTAYRHDLATWIDRVPVVGSNHDIDSLANQVVDILRKLNNHANSNHTIRESVTSIKSLTLQLKSIAHEN